MYRDSLIYPGNIKLKLLNYIYATLVFSDADVDFNIVSWNRYNSVSHLPRMLMQFGF